MELIIIALLVLTQVELLILLTKKHHVSKKDHRGSVVYVDTSALMDGRIMAAAMSGFIPRDLAIPRSVLAELQLLADGSDGDKRTKARHGLDVASALREHADLRVKIIDDGEAEKGVDEQLLLLARKNGGAICTVDYNLAKVAEVEQIKVLNINELAKQLRMNYLPGEKVSLKITQKGNDRHQGVGYLSDGTMVVVEQAANDIDKTVEIEFIRSLQTAAGRMMFAKKIQKNNTDTGSTKKTQARARTSFAKKKRNAEDALVDLANS